jgi:PAS domain S-box-containing protein
LGRDLPHEARGELDASELRETLDFLREGIQIVSPEWRYVYVNDAVAVHGRKRRSELLGRTMVECYPGIETTAMFGVLEACMRDRSSARIENEFQYDNGQRAWFELRIQPCTEGLIVLSLDITERKQLEASVRQDDKLRALGQMAAGIAHDLKNILNPIALQIQLLRSRLTGDGGARDALAAIEEAIRAGSDTVENLRRFSSKEVDRAPEATDLNRFTDVAVEICRPKIYEHPGVQIVRERGPAPQVLVRGSELVTAIVNLVVNAVEALRGAGRITVRTGSAGGAWVEVADDGPGMTAETEGRMFEPFFTTKAQGTGLGLAMVYAFVQRHGGRVNVDTAPGRGTAIRLWFPAAPAPRAAAAANRRGAAGAAGTTARRLMLVEDEPASRQALKMLLEDEGFTVEVAGTGEEALDALPTSPPDMLIADFRLPGMDGVALAHAARRRLADLPVVIVSGFERSSPELAGFLREPRTEHVGKPVDVHVLVGLLRRLAAPDDALPSALSDEPAPATGASGARSP